MLLEVGGEDLAAIPEVVALDSKVRLVSQRGVDGWVVRRYPQGIVSD